MNNVSLYLLPYHKFTDADVTNTAQYIREQINDNLYSKFQNYFELSLTETMGENFRSQVHSIPLDILDDLGSRFIINVPEDERRDLIRICFQVRDLRYFKLLSAIKYVFSKFNLNNNRYPIIKQ
mgnify:CR=1 FL=1